MRRCCASGAVTLSGRVGDGKGRAMSDKWKRDGNATKILANSDRCDMLSLNHTHTHTRTHAASGYGRQSALASLFHLFPAVFFCCSLKDFLFSSSFHVKKPFSCGFERQLAWLSFAFVPSSPENGAKSYSQTANCTRTASKKVLRLSKIKRAG